MAVSLDLTLEADAALREMSALHHSRAPLAIKRAVRKTLRWLHRELLREMARASGIRQAVFRQYRRIALTVGEYEGRVWAGLDPLPAHEAGRVSWSPTSAGASVAGNTYEGAFYRPVYGSAAKVWVRSRRNLAAGNPTYHPRRRYRSFSGDVSHGRFPVEIVAAPMEEFADPVVDRIEAAARVRFATIVRQELNYVINHERR